MRLCKSAKLVDDPYAIYKLLSFLDALSEAIDQYPERASVIQLKINRFQANLDGLPLETVEQAEDLLEEKGRYPLFDSLSSLTQFLSGLYLCCLLKTHKIWIQP